MNWMAAAGRRVGVKRKDDLERAAMDATTSSVLRLRTTSRSWAIEEDEMVTRLCSERSRRAFLMGREYRWTKKGAADVEEKRRRGGERENQQSKILVV